MEGDGFFFCCCEHEADDDSVRITPSARKGSPMRDAHLARYMSEGTPIQLPPAPEPARLRPIGNSSLSVQPPSPDVPKDKAYLVKKLNAQLEQFKTKAFAGMPVEVVNIENGRLNEYVFCFDRYFTVFSLKPRVDKRFNAKVRDFNLKNVVAVYRNCTHQLSTIDAKVFDLFSYVGLFSKHKVFLSIIVISRVSVVLSRDTKNAIIFFRSYTIDAKGP
eukprot:GEMP01098238.1.p1 GENE.GEMP01098238.1~~GEMP01098238.1.p1  ORF type:complete len:218 (+),score=21.39 GEMP01098238.1:140-793(+)